MKAATTDHRVTTRIVAGVAVVGLIVHLLTIHRYGYFRDELYYIACARHLDFGYVDLAPLSAFLLRIELILFSSSLFALRIFPALASAVTVALAGMLARELGGRVWAITLACTGMLGSLIFPAIGNFYSPNVYELLFWTGAIYLLCRIVNGAPSRTWIWLGVVARARNPKQALNGLFRRRNRARDFVNAGASSIWTKMDLAHRFDRICHRASKHHLANRTQLAHLGFIARYRAEPQERRPHTGEIARLHAGDSFRGPTDGNIAYRGVAPALCRSIRLGRNGALGGAGLRQLPSGGAETRCHFLSELRRSGRDRFLWLEIRITASALRPSKLLLLGTGRLHRRDHDCAR